MLLACASVKAGLLEARCEQARDAAVQPALALSIRRYALQVDAVGEQLRPAFLVLQFDQTDAE